MEGGETWLFINSFPKKLHARLPSGRRDVLVWVERVKDGGLLTVGGGGGGGEHYSSCGSKKSPARCFTAMRRPDVDRMKRGRGGAVVDGKRSRSIWTECDGSRKKGGRRCVVGVA